MLRQRLLWFLFLANAFLILTIDKGFKIRYFWNFIREFGEVLKRQSKYTEDKDFILVHKGEIKKVTNNKEENR